MDEFNKINKSEHYRNIKIAIDTLCDTTAEEEKLQKLIKKRDDIIEKDNKLMETLSVSGADLTAEHDKLSKEFENTQNEISEIEAKISEKNDKNKSIELYESELKKALKKITEFDNVLFAMLVDKIIVHKDKTLLYFLVEQECQPSRGFQIFVRLMVYIIRSINIHLR